MFEIRTKRLVLRDILAVDWKAMHRLRSNPEVTLYIDYLKSDTEEETKIWIRCTIHHNSLKPRQSCNLAITRRPDGQVIGWIGIGQASGADAGFLDFGYALLPVD